MPQETLGKGPYYPIQINHHGGLQIARYEEKVHQSILAILSTARGERVMRPEFGCDIHSFVFASKDTTTLTLIKAAVRDALIRWEPRIDVDDIGVAPDPGREGVLLIKVKYIIRATNFPANLVYPFYLQMGN
jgi:phage baseplate assembly protein W